MPSLRQLLKSVHSQPELKTRLKTLIQKSCSCLLDTKPSSNHTFSAGDLPSGSFRSFQFEFSRFSSRTLEVGDSGKPLSACEATSRVFATPSVHGPVWQNFGYHTHQVLLDKNPTVAWRQSMPSSIASSHCRITGSSYPKFQAQFHVWAQDIQSESSLFAVDGFPKPWGVLKNSSWEEEMQNLGIRICEQLEVADLPNLSCVCEFEEAGEGQDTRECKPQLPNFRRSSVPFHFLQAAPCLPAISDAFWNAVSGITHGVVAVKQLDLVFDSSPEDLHFVVEEKASARSLSSKGLRLLSGACYFPHPDKEVTGGEDAYFICPDKQVIGVADGVGGWADMGVDAGEYARQLMSESLIAAREEPTGCVDAARVLEKAHSKTTCPGSSTACILALSDSGLQAVNLGDSGFLIVRNGRMIFKSPAQQHNFNLPFQLESCGGDPVSAAELFVVDVAVGDVIIAGTDGLFDNLYATEMASIVVQATWSGMSPDVTAQKIAYTARERAKDHNRQTPFSAAAQDAGFLFYGGKMDDITVVVSYVTNCNVFKGGLNCL